MCFKTALEYCSGTVLEHCCGRGAGSKYCVLVQKSERTFFVRLRERWRSIVMSTSVCVSVRQDISGTTRAIFINFSVHVAYGRGSILLRQGDEIPRGGQFWGVFFPIYSTAFATHTKTTRECRLA